MSSRSGTATTTWSPWQQSWRPSDGQDIATNAALETSGSSPHELSNRQTYNREEAVEHPKKLTAEANADDTTRYLENVFDEEIDVDDASPTGIENTAAIVYETLEQRIHGDGIGVRFQGKGFF